jgi:hypothetical protein
VALHHVDRLLEEGERGRHRLLAGLHRPSRAVAGRGRLALTTASSHECGAAMGGRLGGVRSQRDDGSGELEVDALPRSTATGIEIVELERGERAKRGAAGEEGVGLAVTSGHRCGAAVSGPIWVPLSPHDDMAGELELGALPRAVVAGIEIIEPSGSERASSAAGSESGSMAGGEIASAEGGGTEGPRERATPRWRTAPQRAQGPPGGGTEIQAGAEPAEELPERVGLQRDE